MLRLGSIIFYLLYNISIEYENINLIYVVCFNIHKYAIFNKYLKDMCVRKPYLLPPHRKSMNATNMMHSTTTEQQPHYNIMSFNKLF